MAGICKYSVTIGIFSRFLRMPDELLFNQLLIQSKTVKQQKITEKMKRLKVGVVGANYMSRRVHLPALSAMTDKLELVAVADLNEAVGRAAADNYGVKYYRPKTTIYADYRRHQ